MDAAQKEELQKAILETATAGEAYIKNVREANKSVSKGAPGIVNKLQGLLSADYQILQNYDPAQKLSLPQIIEGARSKTLLLGSKEIDGLEGAQNSRIPLSLDTADGKKYNGLFTRATYTHVGRRINDAVKKMRNSENCTEEGKKQIDGMVDKMRELGKKEGHDYSGMTPEWLYLHFADMYSRGRNRKVYLETGSFFASLGVDLDEIGWDNAREFAEVLERTLESTNDMINASTLCLKDGSRIDSRASAMSAVTQLFGCPNLLARSNNMRFVDEKGRTLEGTLMDFSDGLDLNKGREALKQVSDDPFSGPDTDRLLKQIADIRVIDYICGNVDRHPGNLMYYTDDNGKIIGIQGIDNDSSFANLYPGKDNYNQLVGTDNMNCITKSMADKVMKMTPTMLKFTLRGGQKSLQGSSED